MQKRLIKALIFLVVAIGLSVGAASAAGAISPFSESNDGISWGLGGSAVAVEIARA